MFNPLIDNEVISVYQSVNRILREKHGYAGIYIIFDEFSKYIEGHAVEGYGLNCAATMSKSEMSI